MKRLRILLCFLPLVAVAGCDEDEKRAAKIAGGDPQRGRETIQAVGCTSCHTIPGIEGADAKVGPNLDQIAVRNVIGGTLPNSADNLYKWLKDPPAVSPKTAMPDLHLTDQQIKDISSYLYTLK